MVTSSECGTASATADRQHQQYHHNHRRVHGSSSWFHALLLGGGAAGAPRPASATAATASGKQQHGLHLLSRHINSEAAKVTGILGAQLLVHFANVQRSVVQHGEDLRHAARAPWRALRLPWHRGGDAGHGPGADGAAHGLSRRPSEAARRWVDKGAEAERQLDLREALSCYQSALALDPSSLANMCRVAKQWSDLTYEQGASTDQIVDANMKAIEYADRAILLAPKWAGGYIASCVSRGRLALFSDNKTKVRLAKEAREAACLALELDPSNDLAHHLMGRWHYEMAQINFVVRQLVRLVYGASLAPGTFTDALSEFQAAVEINPNKLIHRVELGRTYLRLGRKQEALRELAASMELDVDDINAQLEKKEAEELLGKLRHEAGGWHVQPLAWGGPGGDGQRQER